MSVPLPVKQRIGSLARHYHPDALQRGSRDEIIEDIIGTVIETVNKTLANFPQSDVGRLIAYVDAMDVAINTLTQSIRLGELK